VAAIPDTTVLPDQILEGLRGGIEAADVEPFLPGGSLVDQSVALAFDHHRALQDLSFFEDRWQIQCRRLVTATRRLQTRSLAFSVRS
jgi:hypothetical protein